MNDIAKLVNKAIEKGNIKVVSYFLNQTDYDPSCNDNYAIRLASKHEYIEIVCLLLKDKRVDPAANDNHAIELASRNWCIEVVKLLLEDERVDPSAKDNRAIKWASKNGHSGVVKLLKKHQEGHSKSTTPVKSRQTLSISVPKELQKIIKVEVNYV